MLKIHQKVGIHKYFCNKSDWSVSLKETRFEGTFGRIGQSDKSDVKYVHDLWK